MSELNIYGVGNSISSSDYIGFSFNGVHSSELGIKRISEGSRFNENLLPTIQDKTIQVPGGDGMYYFGSYYTQRQFNISYAFDSLTEQQLNRIKAVFGDKKPHRLVFDEAPYKAYLAKVTGSASIKHIPFAEGATNRVYKGEGSIQFTAYEPFARSTHKYLNEFFDWKNIQEWKEAAKLLESQGKYDKLTNNYIELYNPGDREADYICILNFQNGVIPAVEIKILDGDESVAPSLILNEIRAKQEDVQIRINTKLNLIEGYKKSAEGKYVKSSTLYNDCISSGSFTKIPKTFDQFDPNIKRELKMQLIGSLETNFDRIEYDYLYY